MKTKAAPILPSERNQLIDALRGFALLGVLVANLEGFVTFALNDEQALALTTTPADHFTEMFISFFVENKFITLFSLLFGYGFGVVIDRVSARGTPVVPFFLWRMLLLLVIGLVHLGIWWGEILSTYALCGMLLLCFRKGRARTLLVCGLILLCVVCPFLHALRIFFLPPAPERGPLFAEYGVAMHSNSLSRIMGSNYQVAEFIFIHRWAQWRDMAEILGKFLLGYYVFRRNLLPASQPPMALLKKAWWWSIPLSLVYLGINIFLYFSGGQPADNTLRLLIFTIQRPGILSMSLFYALSITLLFYRKKAMLLWKLFMPPGMMSLTNYLTHTVFYVFIYYGIGLGLMGRLHLQWAIPTALTIYSLQVIFSHYWMKRMRYGPVEWLWRQATYRQRLALRR